MLKRVNIYFILIGLVLYGIFGVTLLAQERQEITLIINEIPPAIDNPDFIKGEELRKQSKLNEAINEYKKVVISNETVAVKAEADYRIGICYTWMGKVKDAESKFNEIIKTYPNDRETIAYAQYCLAWVDVQRKQFFKAINRLQRTLDNNLSSEEEYCSKAQFQIGRIYLVFLHDYDKAKEAFSKVLEQYPDSKIVNHPFIKDMIGED